MNSAATKTRSGLACLFPVGAFSLMVVGILINYGIGVSRNDIQKVWPYVSDTGGSPPEMNIFAQFLNMAAGLMMVSLYIRHRHFMAFYKATRHKRAKIIMASRIFLAIGLIASFGLQLVANFQEPPSIVYRVHFTGAAIAFILGIVYGWGQTILSFITPRKFTPRWLALIRLGICVIGTLAFVGVFARGIAGENHALPDEYWTTHNRSDYPKHFYRAPGDPGYAAFLITTICEWILAFCLAAYFLTLAFDLRRVHLHPPKLNLRMIDQLRSIDLGESDVHIRERKTELEVEPYIEEPEDDSVEIEAIEPQNYRFSIEYRPRVNKIALPGLVDAARYEKEENAAQKDAPRGLRRSYDNAIYSGSTDELENKLRGKSSDELEKYLKGDENTAASHM